MRELAAARPGDRRLAAPPRSPRCTRCAPTRAAPRCATVVGLDRVAADRHRGPDRPGGLRGDSRDRPLDRRPRRSARNTLLLAAAMAVYSAVLQLVAAVSSLTFVLVTGVKGLLGLGPAIFLTSSALAAVPAGRLMDRFGRRPVIAGGYLLAAARLLADRARDEHRLDAARDPRLRADRRGERDRAADPHGGGRHVPAGAPRPRDLVRAVRRRVRRDPRPGGVRPAVRRAARSTPRR